MDEKLKSELKEYAYPLRTVVADDDFSDLMPLCEILKNVKIVSLGESTHGTREFSQLKHRVTRFLVEKMGYRVFTIEAGTIPCRNINEYIMMGKGNRAEALASQGYWIWDTEEITDMIEWMRNYNLNCVSGEECQFIGFDIKPIGQACEILRYVTKLVCNEIYEKTDTILNFIQNVPFPLGDYKRDSLNDKYILWLLGWLTMHEIEISEKAGHSLYELAITSCRIVYQYLDGSLMSGNVVGKRDKHMAENIKHLMNRLPNDAKIIVCAHNAHVAVDESWENLGWWLRHWYGDLYYTFGLTYTGGTFHAMKVSNDSMGPLTEFDAGMPIEGFWEHDLMQIRAGDYFMDLRSIKDNNSAARKWACETTKRIRAIGSGFNPENPFPDDCIYDKYVLADRYDGIFHIEKTSPTSPTPTGMRGIGAKPAK